MDMRTGCCRFAGQAGPVKEPGYRPHFLGTNCLGPWDLKFVTTVKHRLVVTNAFPTLLSPWSLDPLHLYGPLLPVAVLVVESTISCSRVYRAVSILSGILLRSWWDSGVAGYQWGLVLKPFYQPVTAFPFAEVASVLDMAPP